MPQNREIFRYNSEIPRANSEYSLSKRPLHVIWAKDAISTREQPFKVNGKGACKVRNRAGRRLRRLTTDPPLGKAVMEILIVGDCVLSKSAQNQALAMKYATSLEAN